MSDPTPTTHDPNHLRHTGSRLLRSSRALHHRHLFERTTNPMKYETRPSQWVIAPEGDPMFSERPTRVTVKGVAPLLAGADVETGVRL